MRRLLSAFFAVLMLFSCVSVSALDNSRLYFECSSAKVGRNTTVVVNVENNNNLASFILEVAFDSGVISYNGYEKTEGVLGVNSKETGKLVIVYLCEDGAENASLFKLKFKTLQSCDSTLEFFVRDAIDTKGRDLELSCDKSVILFKKEVSADKDSLKANDSFNGSFEKIQSKNYLYVKGGTSKNGAYIDVAVCVGLALSGVAWFVICFMKKKKSSINLIYKDSSDNVIYENKKEE